MDQSIAGTSRSRKEQNIDFDSSASLTSNQRAKHHQRMMEKNGAHVMEKSWIEARL